MRFLYVISAFLLAHQVAGHGYMQDPPQRSSMWRFGYNTPVNYEDDELNCGSFGVQWDQNGGKCGECGDAYNLARPRPNESGGKFGTGIIVKEYKAGEVITVSVMMTATHMGYFEFRLCPTNGALEEQSCFDQHLLQLADGSGTQYFMPKHEQEGHIEYNVDVQLPAEVTCEQCVLQWFYRAGNNWGDCEDGGEGMGCGQQETWNNCADVSIS